MCRALHTKRPLIFCVLSFREICTVFQTWLKKGMKKARSFLKVRLIIGEIPGSNPPSMEKPAQAIYENETCFLREKSPQTLGITGKNDCRSFLIGNHVFTRQKRSPNDWGLMLFGFSKESKKYIFRHKNKDSRTTEILDTQKLSVFVAAASITSSIVNSALHFFR